MDLKKRRKDIIYTTLALFLLAIFLYNVKIKGTIDLLSNIDVKLLALVLGLYFMNTGCKVMRWYGLLRGMGAKNIGPVVLPIFLASLALNNSTPGKVGGEPVRAMMLKEQTGNSATLGIATIFAEKSLDILTILALAIFGVIFMVYTLGFHDVQGMVYVIGAGGIIIVVSILLILNRRFVRYVNRVLERLVLRVSKGNRETKIFKMTTKFEDFISRFYRSIHKIGKDPWRGTGVLLMTFIIWMNEALRFYIIIQAIPGDHIISCPGAIAAIAVANILGFILPIGIGNFIGGASVVGLLTGDGSLGSAISLAQVATSLWISIPLGIISIGFLRSRSKKKDLPGPS